MSTLLKLLLTAYGAMVMCGALLYGWTVHFNDVGTFLLGVFLVFIALPLNRKPNG